MCSCPIPVASILNAIYYAALTDGIGRAAVCDRVPSTLVVGSEGGSSAVTVSSHRRRKAGAYVSKRLSTLLFLVVTFLTVFAFTAGSGSAQTTGSATAGTGSATASPTATRAATVAPTATRAATVAATATGGTAVATGTGGATTTTLPATGQPHSNSMNLLLIEVIVLALAIIGTGVALKRRAPRS